MSNKNKKQQSIPKFLGSANILTKLFWCLLLLLLAPVMAGFVAIVFILLAIFIFCIGLLSAAFCLFMMPALPFLCD
jgi:hypothetical protein